MTKSHVFPRQSQQPLPTVVGGQGVHLYDANGKAYFDGSGGAAVSCLGHGDIDVINAVKEQLDAIAFAHTGFFTSIPAERLAQQLIAHAPPGIDRVYFVSGGSEAVEAALKLARQYYLEIGEERRQHIIARRQSYHGNTLGALAAGGNQFRRVPFEPLMVNTHHISPCFEYREKRDDETVAEYGQKPLWRSLPSRWLEQRPVRLRRCRVISNECERFATDTVCYLFLMR